MGQHAGVFVISLWSFHLLSVFLWVLSSLSSTSHSPNTCSGWQIVPRCEWVGQLCLYPAMNCLFSSLLLSCSRDSFLVPPVTWTGRQSQLRWIMETNNVAVVWKKGAEHITVKWVWKPGGCRASCPSQSVLYTLWYLIIREKSMLRK